MNKKELEALALKAASSIKTEQDLNDFSVLLKKIAVEAALGAELDEHPGYDKHAVSGNSNSCNGTSRKTLISEDGTFEIGVPRDRDRSFEPQRVKKQQTRFTGMDDKILFLYAQGLTTREIVVAFKDLYDADVSATLYLALAVNLEGHKELRACGCRKTRGPGSG